MPDVDDASDEFVYDAADQLRHDLLTPVTTISARAQLLARDLRRSPSLDEGERVRLLAGVAAIQTAVETMCDAIDTIGDGNRGP